MVPASDSILPPGPNGNLALQPGHQSRVYRTILYLPASGAVLVPIFGLRRCNARIIPLCAIIGSRPPAIAAPRSHFIAWARLARALIHNRTIERSAKPLGGRRG
jgi:hypothetical protein